MSDTNCNIHSDKTPETPKHTPQKPESCGCNPAATVTSTPPATKPPADSPSAVTAPATPDAPTGTSAGAAASAVVVAAAAGAATADKGDFPHFMLKEIYEQPEALANTLRGRLDFERGTSLLPEAPQPPAAQSPEAPQSPTSAQSPAVPQPPAAQPPVAAQSPAAPQSPASAEPTDFWQTAVTSDLAKVRRVIFLGHGTSMHAGMVARYAFEELAGIPAQVEQSADFRYRNPIVGPGDFVIAVSQSGETTDTLGAVREAREKGAETLGVCNVAGSSLERGTNAFVALHAGPEISIASTKAFTTQVCVLLMLALRFGRARRLSVEAGAAFARELAATPEQVAKVVAQDAAIAEIAKHYAHCEHAYFAGRGPLWAVALEGALKLKETSYLHAEGYHAAEVRHGPVSLLPGLGAKNTPPPCGPAEMPVIALACDIPGKTLTLRDVAEFRARGARVFGIVTEGDTEAARAMDDFIAIPAAHPLTAAISATVALQLFAYHISRLRGCDVDKPRNLTKAVLVAA